MPLGGVQQLLPVLKQHLWQQLRAEPTLILSTEELQAEAKWVCRYAHTLTSHPHVFCFPTAQAARDCALLPACRAFPLHLVG